MSPPGRTGLLGPAGLLSLGVLAPALPAQDRTPDSVCRLCHEATAIDPTAAGLPHAQIACTECHVALERFDPAAEDEHAVPQPHSSCLPCHAQEVEGWRNGAHAGAPENGRPAATCTDCHGTHAIRSARDPLSPTYPLRLPDTCESCHRADPPADRLAPTRDRVREYESSVHGIALRRSGLIVTATCASCHGAHDVRKTADPSAPTSRKNVPRTCGTCHAGILDGYLSGVHGAAFEKGSEDVPVCTDCHGEHSIADPALEHSSVSSLLVSKTCARCHADDELARRYGMPPGRIAGWSRSYHGITSAYGDQGAANCASCHGHHDIFPAEDPRSSVNAGNLERTCGRCHLGAGAVFATVPVHSVVDRESNPVPWTVREIYLWMITGIIAAFVAFILADLFGRLRLRLGIGPKEGEPLAPARFPDEDRLVPPDETFPRLSRTARAQHGLLILSFSVLVLTGLPLLLEIPRLERLVDFEGAFRLRSLAHRAAAVTLIGLSIWHLVAIGLSPGGRRWAFSMMLRPRDVTDFLKEFGWNLGILPWLAARGPWKPVFQRFPGLRCDVRPAHGRYGLVEKLEYGAVIWGNAVMIASGLVLWRPDWFLGRFPVWLFDLSRVVHGYEATLAFLAIIIWHMYHVHLRPGAFPMNRAWLSGRVSREEMRRHHGLEYARILEQRAAEQSRNS